MNSDLKLIYLNSLIDNYIKHYNYLMIELNKINNYCDINDERIEIIDSNIEIITNLDIIKYKISQYNILSK
jgi:hypothetical protein